MRVRLSRSITRILPSPETNRRIGIQRIRIRLFKGAAAFHREKNENKEQAEKNDEEYFVTFLKMFIAKLFTPKYAPLESARPQNKYSRLKNKISGESLEVKVTS